MDEFTVSHTSSSLPSLVPVCTFHVTAINGRPVSRPLLALMDSGSTATLIARASLPPDCPLDSLPTKRHPQTAAGTFELAYGCHLTDVTLPEFTQCLVKLIQTKIPKAFCYYEL